MNSQERVKSLQETVHVLAEQIGPRGSASSAERKAAGYIARRMREAGLRVKMEPFAGLPSFSPTYSFIYGGFLLAALLYPLSPVASFALALLSLLAFVTEINARETISRLLPKGASQNVVGVRPPQQEARRRIILTAHYDSSKAALLFHPAMVSGFRRSFLMMVGAMAIIFLLSLVGLFRPLGWLWYIELVCGLYLGVSVLLMVHREVFMEHTPGANDNASGVAVMLAAVEELGELANSELWAVATGCEESGLGGMQAFMREHSSEFDKDSTYFINLDNLGAGKAAYITSEGALFPVSSDRELLKLAGEVVNEEGLDVEARPYHLLTTDALVPLVRGYKAMSVMAFDEQGLLPNWHWHTDQVENLDFGTMENALRLVVGLVRKLDAL